MAATTLRLMKDRRVWALVGGVLGSFFMGEGLVVRNYKIRFDMFGAGDGNTFFLKMEFFFQDRREERRFVLIGGGAGKTTQIEQFARWLGREGGWAW